MVYAAYGRAGIYLIKEYCRLLGIGSSDRNLRDLGATLQALPPDHPIAAVMRSAKDFRSPDALADALLHPIDRAYTVPQLYEWLERCGMSFGRWVEQAPYLPQCGIIKKTAHAQRLNSLPPTLQHAAVELFRGTIGRPKVNSDFIQPFLTYSTRDGWTYALNTESSYDWTHNHWAVPIHFQISKIVRFGTQPMSLGGALRCFATSPSGGPQGCGIRMVVTALFPKKG